MIRSNSTGSGDATLRKEVEGAGPDATVRAGSAAAGTETGVIEGAHPAGGPAIAPASAKSGAAATMRLRAVAPREVSREVGPDRLRVLRPAVL